MAYFGGVANNIGDLISVINTFATNNGWELVTQDGKLPVLGAVSGQNLSINPRSLATPNNKALLGATRAGNVGRVSTIAESALTGTRLVLKDPNGVYFHLFGFDNLTGWIDGQASQSLAFLELWISDGFSGAGADIFNHTGLVKMGVGGPYRASMESFHLFTGTNKYNNKKYFNIVIETSPASFEHFSFGSIETYLNMQYGEFWQGSGQVASRTGQTAGYVTSQDTNNTWYRYVNTLWGSVGPITLAQYDISFADGTVGVGGGGSSGVANPNLLSAGLVRYAMPGWGRDKAFLCNTGLTRMAANAVSVGLNNEFMPNLLYFAGIPTLELTPNAYSGVSVFTPAYIGAFSPQENDYWGLIGHYPNQRICNIANNNPKDIVLYGQDEWMLFPLCRKGSTTFSGTWPVESGNYGVAYKK